MDNYRNNSCVAGKVMPELEKGFDQLAIKKQSIGMYTEVVVYAH